MESKIKMNPNPLVQYIKKPQNDFTKADIIKYIEDNNIKMVNFRYVASDRRLKTLNFIINNKSHLETLLSAGERVDGSNVFPYIEAGSSDLYIIPRFKTAYLNPFMEIPTIDMLCSFYDKNGRPFIDSPENILRKAHKTFKEHTGFSFEAMGELEFYVIHEKNPLFPAIDQKGYHESIPFAKCEDFRDKALQLISQCGGLIKYGHSEVGNFTQGNLDYEQNEIEFIPTNIEDAADQLVIAKWILRTLAYKNNVNLTFAPKITAGKAGSGLHIHTRIVKNNKNVFVENGKLSDIAKKVIAGYLNLAPSLTAFGNSIPTSYFRLVPHQEAPTNICWGDRNRSVLVRVPLGWINKMNMVKNANPLEKDETKDFSYKQTVELRSPDGSADIYLLLAGLVVAAHYGLEMKNALEYAEKNYVSVNIFDKKYININEKLDKLPDSCSESADYLKKQSEIYKKFDVFPQRILDAIFRQLKSFNDKTIRKNIEGNNKKIIELVDKYIHYA
jgi:glutamine synthetase